MATERNVMVVTATERRGMDTAGGIEMVVVKVRETYDLHTVKNKMSLIAIHTPKPDIIKMQFPGLLMNYKYYRPLSADVRIACASVLPLDPLGVGTTEGDIAPEDVFNPFLFKAMTNESFSLLEGRILAYGLEHSSVSSETDVAGSTAVFDNNGSTPYTDDFAVYYGLLSDAHGWRHAMPQNGLMMTNLVPLVHEVLSNFQFVPRDNIIGEGINTPKNATSTTTPISVSKMSGNARPLPRMPCTTFPSSVNTSAGNGFGQTANGNGETVIPWFNTVVAGIIVPPSRLHELYFRMVVEWSIEFSECRSMTEIMNWAGVSTVGITTHYQSYNFAESKVLNSDQSMASANVELDKVM